MSIKTTSLGAVSLLAAAVFAGPALADGISGRGRVADAPAPRTCSTTGNVGLTTDYVFRGISQTLGDAAVQGGVDFTCGRFYAGVWASNVDFGAVDFTETVANLEIDIYGGFKHTTGPVTWDVGFIYYAYPGQLSGADLDVLELKLGASGEIWRGGTLGGTVFYNPDDDILTLEGTIAQALPKVGIFAPTLSGTLGNVSFDDDSDFTYWNIGLTAGFLEKWSVDFRYWDTDIEGGCPADLPFTGTPTGTKLCDERFVASVKYTF